MVNQRPWSKRPLSPFLRFVLCSATSGPANRAEFAISKGGNLKPMFDLGKYSRPITTSSTQSQSAFDRGLNWLYGYNHEAAADAFAQAHDADAGCGAALWGLAYAIRSYCGKWVTEFEKAAYRGGCPSLPELPKGTIRHGKDYRYHRPSSAGNR